MHLVRPVFTAVLLVVMAAALTSCSTLRREAAPNTLSKKERAAGWQLLFDGAGFSGWRGYQSQTIPAKWNIEDEALHLRKMEEGGGDLISTAQYGDFELYLEWKISECGNSGVFFHVSEDLERTYHTGPEIQILDNSCHPDAKNGPDRYAGANYALHAPVPVDAARPAGEWNHLRVVVQGPRVQQWLNGIKVVEYELWSDDWNRRVQASKFKQWPQYGMVKRGHIALQDHGDPVWFRNIKIRPLDGPV